MGDSHQERRSEGLQVVDLHVAFSGRDIFADAGIVVGRGEIVGLIGASGVGKTTLLRAVTGLVDPQSGSIIVNGRRIDHLPVRKRPVQYMQQDFPLYNHMTVRENVGLVTREAAWGGTERLWQQLGLRDDLWQRYPEGLSGGERQRIALVKALARCADVLLLDEPLSNVDRHARSGINRTIREWVVQHQVACIYVTHEEADVIVASDRLAIVEDGHISKPESIDRLTTRLASPQELGLATLPSLQSTRFTNGDKRYWRPDESVLAKTDPPPSSGVDYWTYRVTVGRKIKVGPTDWIELEITHPLDVAGTTVWHTGDTERCETEDEMVLITPRNRTLVC